MTLPWEEPRPASSRFNHQPYVPRVKAKKARERRTPLQGAQLEAQIFHWNMPRSMKRAFKRFVIERREGEYIVGVVDLNTRRCIWWKTDGRGSMSGKAAMARIALMAQNNWKDLVSVSSTHFGMEPILANLQTGRVF